MTSSSRRGSPAPLNLVPVLLAGLVLTVLAGVVGCATGPPDVETYPRSSAGRIMVHGVEIHYFDFNSQAPGVPIVWLHGYSGSAFEATYIVPELGPGNRLIAPDFPGAGYSEKPEIEYTLEYYVDFVHGFLRALEIDRYVIVGHSMGGLVAATFAAERPEGLERLVLVAPYGQEGQAGPIIDFLVETGVLADSGNLVDMGLELHNQTIIDLALRANVFHDPGRIPQDLSDYIAVSSFHTPNAGPALASITRNIIATRHDTSVLSDIAVPTLLIWGIQDRVLSIDFAERFRSSIPDVDFRAVPDAGHLPHVERPELTAQYIVQFIR